MASHAVHGLPFLPGNTYRDPTKSAFQRSQTLTYRNGYSRPLLPTVGIGRDPITVNQLSQAELDELANKRPTLTYGQVRQAPPSSFIPVYVAFDKQVLRFEAYFKETVPISQDERYRVRRVSVYYYLEDDTISVVEPPVENSGIPQGTFIKRHRHPKNDNGDHYHWKDLNVGINITLYGRTFRIVSCDKFTQDFLESEGIELNLPEEIPPDPYTEFRREPNRTYTTPPDFDKLKQFLTMDRKVLRFFSLWDDSDSMFRDTRPVIIHYYLVDDTVEVREVHERNDGRDPFPVLMKRQHLPKSMKDLRDTFPKCVLEISAREVAEWYSPRDFIVGRHVTILGRKFFLYDCDAYTKDFYKDKMGIQDLTPADVKKPKEEEVKQDHRQQHSAERRCEALLSIVLNGVGNEEVGGVRAYNQREQRRMKTRHGMQRQGQEAEKASGEIPPYNGFGLLEDSLQNCLTLVPKPPKKDVIKMLENDHKVLRYAAALDSMNPEDKGRRFILSYYLSDDTISIFEPQIRNSGIIGGKFLEKSKIPKPGSSLDNPTYYGPADFTIGAVVEVFRYRFIITDADQYVLNYITAHKHQFPCEVLSSLKKHFQPQDGEKEARRSDVQETTD